MSSTDGKSQAPAKAARRKSQANLKSGVDKKKNSEESKKPLPTRPRLFDAEYQKQRLLGALPTEKQQSTASKPQYGALAFGADSQMRTVRARSSSGTLSLTSSKEQKKMNKKNPLGGMFLKPSKDKKDEDKSPTTSMDKRQKEQKKRLEAELAKREQEKQKKDKEVKHILSTYLDEQLAQGTQSKMKAPLGVPRFEPAPLLIPRVFLDAAK